MGVTGKPLSEDMIRRVRATYYGMVSYLDYQLGRIFESLEETGAWKDTVIVYTADHGEMLGEHLRWNKMNFYEQAVKVPLIVSRPSDRNGDHRGRRIDRNVSLVDLSETILELANAEPPRELAGDGRCLLPLLNGNTESWDNCAFSELYHEYNMHAPMAMLKRDNLKLNYYYGETPELFDLEKDPGETKNLAEDPSYAEIRTAMEAELLSRWNPEKLDKKIRNSQQRRNYLSPYLFGYIDKDRKTVDKRFTGDLNT
jgi:choline-sulfatase